MEPYPNEPGPRVDRDVVRRRDRDCCRRRRAVGADPPALDDILAADRQGVGQAARGYPRALQRGSSRSRPAAPRARGPDCQDAAEPQEQREERLALAGAGKGYSRAWSTLAAAIGGVARSDRGSACSLETVVLYAVLLGEPHRSS